MPKLQLLALDQIEKLFKTLDYQHVKTNLMPRVLKVLEDTQNNQVRIKVLEMIKTLQDAIDAATMKAAVFKTFEKLRGRDNDPQVCMLMLQIYQKSSDSLGADEIGTKILPSIIPLLVSSQLSKHQFEEIMAAVRGLLDRIE